MEQSKRKSVKPFSLLVKPVGSRCNLDCRYCFYTGTDDLLGGNRPAVMTDTILNRMIEDYLSLGFQTSVFIWQGGEPSLAGLDFYRRVVEGQAAHGQRGQTIANALQTNGILIDSEWAAFLNEYRFLVGLSLDGTAEIHNHYRTDKTGKPTFDRVMDAAECLRRNSVEFNILCMITGNSETSGSEIYRFLVSEGFYYLQFIPCVEYDRVTGNPSPYNASSQGYGRFMCDVFDAWYEHDVGRVSVRTFDALVLQLARMEQVSMCTIGKICDHYVVVEKEGDVYPCDFFVDRQYCLGNIMENSLLELYNSDREKSFSLLKSQYPSVCRTCAYLDLCFGGCPKDRLCTGEGEFGQVSALCEGLKLFYGHTKERFRILSDTVRLQKTGKEVNHHSGDSRISVGRNDPCPCGSGKKYKHCCMK